MLGIVYLWFYAAKQGKIGSLEGKKKFGALCLLTGIILVLLGFHETILYTLAISSGCVFAHAVFHKVPDAMIDLGDEDIVLLGSGLDSV